MTEQKNFRPENGDSEDGERRPLHQPKFEEIYIEEELFQSPKAAPGFSIRSRIFVFIFSFFALFWSFINSIVVTLYLIINLVTFFQWTAGQNLMYRFTAAAVRWLSIGAGSIIFAFSPPRGLAFLLKYFISTEAARLHPGMLERYLRSNFNKPFEPEDEDR